MITGEVVHLDGGFHTLMYTRNIGRQMKPLDQVYSKIVSIKSSGSIPLVVFDLDDTIIDCRHRKMFVLNEFCSLM